MIRRRGALARLGLGAMTVLAGVFASARATAAPTRLGMELVIGANFSEHPFLGTEGRRFFPPYGAVTGTVRLGLSRRVSFVTGIGYEQSLRTDHLDIALLGYRLEGAAQNRERASVLPLTVEFPIVSGWNVAGGVEWRHVFSSAFRAKELTFTTPEGVTETMPAERTWDDASEVPKPDRLDGTLAVTRTWSGEWGSRSIGLRWVHGFQDLEDDPDLESRHRALHLVLAWSR